MVEDRRAVVPAGGADPVAGPDCFRDRPGLASPPHRPAHARRAHRRRPIGLTNRGLGRRLGRRSLYRTCRRPGRRSRGRPGRGPRAGCRACRQGYRVRRPRRSIRGRTVAGRSPVRRPIPVMVPVPRVVIAVAVVDRAVHADVAAAASRRLTAAEHRRRCEHQRERENAEGRLHGEGSSSYSNLTMPVTPPFGSTKTATLPPYSSSLGWTIANPPPATTFSSVAATSSTRT